MSPQSGSSADRAARRRRLDEVFGQTLAEQTRDDLDDEVRDRGAETDRRLRREVPPHHGTP